MKRRLLAMVMVSVALWHAPARADSLFSEADLLKAAKTGDSSLARDALLRGDDPDILDEDGNTPLIRAIKNNHPAIVTALLGGHAQPNRAGADGKTPLYLAAQSGNVDVLNELIKAGAKLDLGIKGGITPLMVAAASDQQDAVSTLLLAGAKVDRTDYTGRDALGWAEDAHDPRIIQILKAAQKK